MQLKTEISEDTMSFPSHSKISELEPAQIVRTASLSSERPRIVLTSQTAREIFELKNTHHYASLHSASLRLASKYGVSSKAIRDIWKGRSWLEATYDLWNVEDRPARRIIGRPKGKKDSKPRMRGSKNDPANANLHAPATPERLDKVDINSFPQPYSLPAYAQSHAGFQASAITCMRESNLAAETRLSSLGDLLAGFVAGLASPYSCAPPHHVALQLPPLPASQPIPWLLGPSPPLAGVFAPRGDFFGAAALPPLLHALGRGLPAELGLHAAALGLSVPARCY